MVLRSRPAKRSDVALLAELNHQLIRDEGHRNPMTVPQLRKRMRGWLGGEYKAVLFEDDSKVVAYALYREEPTQIYLRQFFVRRERRRKGYGSQAMQILRGQIWPGDKRLTVMVLSGNSTGIAFWKAAGFQEYCLTLEMNPIS